MMKGLKKAAVLGLSAALALTSAAGCSKKETFDTEAAAVTVNGTSVSAGVLNVAVRYNQAGYESLYMSLGLTDPFSQDLYGYGTTLGDDVKSQLATEMTHALLAEQKMDEYGVSISEEDKDKIETAAADFMAANDAEVLEKIGITQDSVTRYLELSMIELRMETAMSADVDTEVSDEEAAQRKIQYVLFTPEAEETEAETDTEETTEAAEAETDEAQTDAAETDAEAGTEAAETDNAGTDADAEEAETAALTGNDTTKTQSASETEEVSEAETENASEAETEETETETEDPETAAAKERARAHAVEMIEKLQAGEDFDTVAEEMGKSANTTTFGDDYTVTELVEATDGLEDGTLIEEPVETDSGYYVVNLISQLDREATDSKKESIVDERRQERISELYAEWEEAGEVSVDSDVLATITFNYHLTPQTEEETEAGTETAAAETETAGTEAAETEAAGAAAQADETEAAETDAEETETEAAETQANETEPETQAEETETEAQSEATAK